MLDRAWWIWQMQDPETRVGKIPGQAAMAMNHPGMTGQHFAQESIVDLGWIAPPVPLADLNDQLGGNGGQFCYIYV